MSFFRNIRSSITRSKSSSRDTTPVKSSSRPSSMVSTIDGDGEKRRDSINSASAFNRSDTFILDNDDLDQQEQPKTRSSSNNSSFEKKPSLSSKKSKVLSKFSTFTKRKKSPREKEQDLGGSGGGGTYEHHPSDNATNTYYKWNSDGSSMSNCDYDAQSDPFNFLYEKHSNLKLLQNANDSSGSGGGGGGATGASSMSTTKNHGGGQGLGFDSSTYRKGKATTQLKAQLEQLKSLNNTNPDLCEEEQEHPDSNTECGRTGHGQDKYKTVTLNSFRKSFRERFLQQQKENNPDYNPSWFIEVEPAPAPASAPATASEQSPTKSQSKSPDHEFSKENRPDCLVFDNDNYRPGSRSPVRDRTKIASQSRSITRSPVKRNETFRVERRTGTGTGTAYTNDRRDKSPTPSIRVEIKNSLMPPLLPGRMVPIGVAKPMPSSQRSNNYFRTPSTLPVSSSTLSPLTSSNASNAQFLNGSRQSGYFKGSNSSTPQRSPFQSKMNLATSATSSIPSSTRSGRYQTLVQISGDNNNSPTPPTKMSLSPVFNRRSRPMSARIQLAAFNSNSNGATTALPQKFSNDAGSRYSYVCPNSVGLSSYELLRNSNNAAKPQQSNNNNSRSSSSSRNNRLKHTYFGGDVNATPTRLFGSIASSSIPTSRTTTTMTTALKSNIIPTGFEGSHIHSQSIANKLRNQSPKRRSPSRTTITTNQSLSAAQQLQQQQQEQRRHVLPMQRRSRSPIKMPWR